MIRLDCIWQMGDNVCKANGNEVMQMGMIKGSPSLTDSPSRQDPPTHES